MTKNSQLKFYTDLLKENEVLLLKSSDSFFKNHYTSSPLSVLTNFKGTEGEAVVEKSGKITLFVDTRYHLLADKQVFKDIEVYKMDLSETFFDAFCKKYKKNTIMHVPFDILFKEYMKLSKYFDLRKYEPKKSYVKNKDLDFKNKIFQVDKKIEKKDFNFKIQKLKAVSKEIERMLIFDLDFISYLTNLRSFQSKFSSNFRAYLYLDFKKNEYILFSDYILKFKIENLKFKKLDEFHNFIKSIKKDIYIDIQNITLENFLSVNKPKELKHDNIFLLPSIKPICVIDNLCDSFSKLDFAIFNFKNKIKANMSECDLVELFEKELLKTGAKCPSFKTILALDDNSASIHYSTYDKKKILKPEMLILLDCGGYWDSGYATDITRTFYFGKNPKKIYKTIYTNVLKAFIECFLSKETNAKKVDKLARNILKPFENDGFYFNHGLGHGIGTSVHQNPPRLSIASNDIIKPYQTHSIEPGLYGKSREYGVEFGVRIENCVYFDLNYKRHSLSKFPFEEILIDYDLLNDKQKEFVENWQGNFKWKKTK